MLVSIGDKAADFFLPTQDKGKRTLKALQGKWVLLYFYPRDHTVGCTAEAKNFNDLQAAFKALDVVIIGISTDDTASHERFKKKHALTFALIADVDSYICKQYGVWVEKSFLGKKYMGIQRSTFLIDKEGSIAFIWPKVRVSKHAEEVLAKIKAMV
ncbi:MAG: thioredoxin-dependent thiol peroxidase [Candidatus Cardinium sp.]|nr:thioredoxin-dependent thiol peroxidase [Candidatus Cardinium sp.]